MKKLVLLLSVILAVNSAVFSQGVKKLDPYNITYEKNTLLVKYKDETRLPKVLGKGTGLLRTGVASIDKLYEQYKVEEMEPVFKGSTPALRKQTFKDNKGNLHEVGNLDKIYKLKYKSDLDAKELANAFSQDNNVEYAEPDYHYYTLVKPDDPLYQSNSQWYIDAVHAPEAWDVTTGDTTQVIGILDTGVDWEHPDLVNKIWHNYKEIPGNGIDDDGNGYVDDVMGWDFINKDNNPKDDNSHGTHVAGIAAGESNNGVGITGIAWGSKIMPIKILQSSGQGNASDIAAGINYAAQNGATVINMSFGSYAESQTMKAALENAYNKAVLVAAAGNDGMAIIQEAIISASMYPACYPWVLGVQASQKFPDPKTGSYLAGFSNFDPSGPVEFRNSLGHNYELLAPGDGIYSTFPNNGYRTLSGTSMAAPIVSGTVALMKSHRPTQTTEELFARLIQSSNGGVLNIKSALDYPLSPDLHFVSHTIVDTLAGDDKDERADAGETIELYLAVKNAGGKADSVYAKLSFAEFEDTTTAQILKNKSYIGSISAYATLTGKLDPFKIKINPNVVNNRDIVFQYEVTGANCTPITGKIIIKSQNGYEVGGLITADQEWTPDKEYLVVDNVRVMENVTVTVKPGTVIKLLPKKSIEVRGKLRMIGTKNNMIELTSSDPANPGMGLVLNTSSDTSIVRYVNIHNVIKFFEQSANTNGYSVVENSIISDCNSNSFNVYLQCDKLILRNNLFNRNSIASMFMGSTFFTQSSFTNNVVVNNYYYGGENTGGFITSSNYNPSEANFSNNSLFNNVDLNYRNHHNSIFMQGTASYVGFTNNYWGTTELKEIEKNILDFYDDGTLPVINLTPVLIKPSSQAHGHVWKVLVDGKDPQEETIDPVASEKVRFDVCFNRSMDTKVTPFLTFGVREPFTQRAVVDSASWSADSTVWTAYYTTGLETGDGINTVRVVNAKDNENFPLPEEYTRFRFTIQAAGAKSTEFIAKADIGKILLEWPAVKKSDMLGYDMYRYTMVNDSTSSEVTKINRELFTDSTYTDYNVVPNKTYYYMYKVVGTDFKESDYSKTISASALSASKGDANGDKTVNVMDITAIVNYLLNKNPQPFLNEAADVNSDGAVNVLDIVASVNIIMGQNAAPKTLASSNPLLIFSPNKVDLKDMTGISAIQLKIACKDLQDAKIIPGEMLKRMEYGYKIDNDTLCVVAFNLRNSSFDKADGNLFSISKGRIQNVAELIASNSSSGKVEVKIMDSKNIIPNEYSLEQNYPNPFNPSTTIRYGLPEKQNVEVMIFNILGQRVRTFTFGEQTPGFHEFIWDSRNDFNSQVSSGVYIYQVRAGKYVSQKKMLMLK